MSEDALIPFAFTREEILNAMKIEDFLIRLRGRYLNETVVIESLVALALRQVALKVNGNDSGMIIEADRLTANISELRKAVESHFPYLWNIVFFDRLSEVVEFRNLIAHTEGDRLRAIRGGRSTLAIRFQGKNRHPLTVDERRAEDYIKKAQGAKQDLVDLLLSIAGAMPVARECTTC